MPDLKGEDEIRFDNAPHDLCGQGGIMKKESDIPHQVDAVVIRAFQTILFGIKSVVFTTTAGKARYVTYRSARDADYDCSIPEIQVRRIPEMDHIKLDGSVKPGKCYSMEHISKYV